MPCYSISTLQLVKETPGDNPLGDISIFSVRIVMNWYNQIMYMCSEYKPTSG